MMGNIIWVIQTGTCLQTISHTKLVSTHKLMSGVWLHTNWEIWHQRVLWLTGKLHLLLCEYCTCIVFLPIFGAFENKPLSINFSCPSIVKEHFKTLKSVLL